MLSPILLIERAPEAEITYCAFKPACLSLSLKVKHRLLMCSLLFYDNESRSLCTDFLLSARNNSYLNYYYINIRKCKNNHFNNILVLKSIFKQKSWKQVIIWNSIMMLNWLSLGLGSLFISNVFCCDCRFSFDKLKHIKT